MKQLIISDKVQKEMLTDFMIMREDVYKRQDCDG